MVINSTDVIQFKLSDNEIKDAIITASEITGHIIDRANLHSRDYLERYFNCLLGEIAEKTVIAWLRKNGKFAESAVDKKSMQPDLGHDVWVLKSKIKIKASIKSSVSATKSQFGQILSTFTIACQPKEIRELNIQVYFWLDLYGTPRVVVPCVSNCGIFAWATKEDLEQTAYQPYHGEMRQAPEKRLKDFRPMKELLKEVE